MSGSTPDESTGLCNFRHLLKKHGLDSVTKKWVRQLFLREPGFQLFFADAIPSVTLDKYGYALNDHKRASVEKLGGVYSSGRGIPRSRER